MGSGDFRPGVTIRIRPGVAMDRSGSGFGLDWTGLDRIGSAWIGFRSDWIRFGSAWIGFGSDLGTNLGHLGCKLSMRNATNHCFSYGICRFYVCVGNVGLHAILGPTCSQLEHTWGHLGPTLDRLGPNFVRLGANLGEPSATWSRSWLS